MARVLVWPGFRLRAADATYTGRLCVFGLILVSRIWMPEHGALRVQDNRSVTLFPFTKILPTVRCGSALLVDTPLGVAVLGGAGGEVTVTVWSTQTAIRYSRIDSEPAMAGCAITGGRIVPPRR